MEKRNPNATFYVYLPNLVIIFFEGTNILKYVNKIFITNTQNVPTNNLEAFLNVSNSKLWGFLLERIFILYKKKPKKHFFWSKPKNIFIFENSAVFLGEMDNV